MSSDRAYQWEAYDYSEEVFAQMFNAYDGLSPDVEGFTKTDAMIGQGVLNKIRDQRVSEETIDMYKPWARMVYNDLMSRDETDQARENFVYFIQHGFSDQIWDDFEAFFFGYDHDGDGRLNREEWLTYYRQMLKFTYGEDTAGNSLDNFSVGDLEFFWTMANAMSERPWNRWGHHGWGVSL